jgi:hypothetical protein
VYGTVVQKAKNGSLVQILNGSVMQILNCSVVQKAINGRDVHIMAVQKAFNGRDVHIMAYLCK